MTNIPFVMIMTSYSFTDQCKREFLKLSKKYRSLEKDIGRFCKFTINLENDKGFPSNNKNYALLKKNEKISIFKARMTCESLHKNKFRVVYARHKESIRFIFIELYSKSQKNREDQNRIGDYLSLFP